MPDPHVDELRIVIRTEAVDDLARLLHDVLGLRELAQFTAGDARAVVVEVPRATIEVGNTAHVRAVDHVEVGTSVSPDWRLALGVDDARATTERMQATGLVETLAEPTRTPWGSLNSRLTVPGAVQVTLFENAGGDEEFVALGATLDEGGAPDGR
jgi:lactoylglutathione lyase